MSVSEVASMFRCSTNAVVRWILRGKLKGYKQGGQYQVDRRDALEFLKSRAR